MIQFILANYNLMQVLPYSRLGVSESPPKAPLYSFPVAPHFHILALGITNNLYIYAFNNNSCKWDRIYVGFVSDYLASLPSQYFGVYPCCSKQSCIILSFTVPTCLGPNCSSSCSGFLRSTVWRGTFYRL